ncbi:MAG: L-threonylcarbamoyladenylate synthase [Sphingobacterium thalpophilum]
MITTDFNSATEALLKHELVAIPTETVYGLAGNAYNDAVIRKIFDLKKRPLFNPLIVHIKSESYLNEVAQNIPDKALQLAKRFWPGPLTLLLEKKPHISDLLTAGKETVAVRVPNHSLTLAVLEKLDFPLAAPSANPFGSISPTLAEHVLNYFGESLGVILDGGECELGIESTIIGFEGNEAILYRLGSLSIEEIEQEVGTVRVNTKNDKNPEAPGMLSRHYSPSTDTYLTNNVSDFLRQFEGKKIGLLLFKDKYQKGGVITQEILSQSGDLTEATKNMYAALHRLDQANIDVIVAEKLPDHGLGKTINDRLQRAVQK